MSHDLRECSTWQALGIDIDDSLRPQVVDKEQLTEKARALHQDLGRRLCKSFGDGEEVQGEGDAD